MNVFELLLLLSNISITALKKTTTKPTSKLVEEEKYPNRKNEPAHLKLDLGIALVPGNQFLSNGQIPILVQVKVPVKNILNISSNALVSCESAKIL